MLSLLVIFLNVLVFVLAAKSIDQVDLLIEINPSKNFDDVQKALEQNRISFPNLSKIENNLFSYNLKNASKIPVTTNKKSKTLISNNYFKAKILPFKKRAKRDLSDRKFTSPSDTSISNDPYFFKMWYLKANRKLTSMSHMNVTKAWDLGYTGKGVVLTVIDDGIEYSNEDLKKNYDGHASYDINDDDNNPLPRYTINNFNKHGTRCAGIIAAEKNNKICITGIAHNARIGGIRMLDGPISDITEMKAISFRNDHIDIYSSSWGPDDDGKTIDGPGRLTQRAFREGVTNGRNGWIKNQFGITLFTQK